ncbi:MAG: hypothetical protein ACRBC3_17480 [Burkholderiaceae bacterium]
MNTQIKSLSSQMLWSFIAIGVATAFSYTSPAGAAQSQAYDLGPGLAAKLAKEKIKQRGPRRRSSDYGSRNSGNGAGDGACGQVDIGNSNSGGGRQTAAQRFRERNRTVIVTGPVINAARCR